MAISRVEAPTGCTRDVSRMLAPASLVAGVVAAAVFLVFPQIDLWAGRGLYSPELERAAWLTALRFSLVAAFWVGVGVAFAGFLVARTRKSPWLGLDTPRWLFLCICLTAGPGLVANVILKDNWGRARPKQVVEFGGSKAFTPPLLPTNQCRRNCSFVSGEASAMFVPFYAAALVIPHSSVPLLAAGTLAGLAAGLIRMAQGGHFLSDVIFAGIFMALTAALVHRLMFAWRWPGLLEAARGRRAPAA